MKDFDFVAVDFETVDLSLRYACQVGIAAVKNGVIVDRILKFIQPPENKYTYSAMQIHHITPEMTKDEPTFDIVWEEIKEYFIGQHLVAHNANFDKTTLYKNLDYYGIMPMGIGEFSCTFSIWGAKLNECCEAFNIDCSRHHNALFDAECCAQLYLNHLNGVEPCKPMSSSTKKQSSLYNRKDSLHGDIFKKDLTKANPKHPFYDRKVVITGNFSMTRKELQMYVKQSGGDLDTSVTKKTHFVLVGEEPGPSKMVKIDKLIHDGFNIRVLHQKELNDILDGQWDEYRYDKEKVKDLDFTYEHFDKHKLDLSDMQNKIAMKELFYGKGFRGNFDIFNQITGNLGASGDNLCYPETNICVLSDSTIEQLKNGVKDETVIYIQKYYNSSKSIIFDFEFVSESDILDFTKRWCEAHDDEVTKSLYDKYLSSIEPKPNPTQTTTPSDFVFKDGKNHCIKDGKVVFRLSDGRTWFPTRQIR